MSYEIIGKLVVKYPIVQRTESFKTREFVIEKTEEIAGRQVVNYIKFQCVQDKTALPDRCNIGDDVKVQFNIKGTKWTKDGKENFITNLDAWRLETIKMSEQSAPPPVDFNQTTLVNNAYFSSGDDMDDLPF